MLDHLLAAYSASVSRAWLAAAAGLEQGGGTFGSYLHADMTQKERAIVRTQPLSATPGRYRLSDSLLAFLEAL